ncbi:MAG TPA: hypothetical protein VNE62_13260 [Actinomycetota bacterium]|nr:hypothetical protein [Actinomycetota bacterium]
MGVLAAGEGGACLVAASLDPDITALAVEGLAVPASTPAGRPVLPVEALPDDPDADEVRLLAGEPSTRAAVASWARDRGLTISRQEPPMLGAADGVTVVAVSSTRTGSAKTAVARRVVRALRRSGVPVAVVRHPQSSLLHWPQAAGTHLLHDPRELSGPRPMDQREELAPLLGAGVPVATGLDPRAMLQEASSAAQVVVWDGGGSAAPWVRPDLHIVAVDAMRGPDELSRDRLASADAVVVTKVDSAPEGRVREWEDLIADVAPDASLTLADLPVGVPEGSQLVGRDVVVVEDWPSLGLGGLKAGAGAVAARRFRCGVVDPRPFARGAIARALRDHPHIGPVIPSLGRTAQEQDDLAASVAATPGQAVLWASPASPEGLLDAESRPVLRVYPELMEVAGASVAEILRPILSPSP